ncbi:MAG: SAM-dependent chlorinase/fluorinase [Acidimicrobiia bacterium]|nr:SAM-dependent chlorinase/fluorinase [Acidimicrobiia bacterium]
MPESSELPQFVSFLSDFGRGDEFVGVCHAVMLELAPHLRIVDISHEIAPFDVRAGALALVRSVQYLPPGIVLAVVDPGVGTDRRVVAVEVEHGVLVGPDNGLLAPAVAMLGGPRRIVSITSEAHRLTSPGATFAGRDVMAPAVGHLASGVPLDELGEEVDPAGLVPGLLPLPREHEGRLLAEVLWVDRFGNCQINVGPEELSALGVGPGDGVEVRFGDQARRARWVAAYAEAKPSELVIVVDSYGLASIAVDRRSAAVECGLRSGSAVEVVPPGAGDSIGGEGQAVHLTERRR